MPKSPNERDEDNADTGDRGASDPQNGEQDRNLEKGEEEITTETDKEQVDRGREEEGSGEDRNQEQKLEQESKTENEDEQEEKEDEVTEQAVHGAFLQVSEPSLVSAHHDGFLRFWNLSVSFEYGKWPVVEYLKTFSGLGMKPWSLFTIKYINILLTISLHCDFDSEQGYKFAFSGWQ